jgi:hypothetical protein
MFAIPQILSLPLLSGLDSGTLAFPVLGNVLVWTLIAALVGSALGFMRELSGRGVAGVASRSTAHPTVGSGDDCFVVFEDHREAA